jgi:hypothetical protein
MARQIGLGTPVALQGAMRPVAAMNGRMAVKPSRISASRYSRLLSARLLLAPLIALCCNSLHAAETGRILEFASVDLRLAYDSIPTTATVTSVGLIGSKQDSGQQDAFCPEPVVFEEASQTNSPPNDFNIAGPVEGGTVSLRAVTTGKVPSLGVFRKRLPSRYSAGAWLDLQSGYGDVLVEDRVGRVQMNGAGIEDPNFFYLKLCFKF